MKELLLVSGNTHGNAVWGLSVINFLRMIYNIDQTEGNNVTIAADLNVADESDEEVLQQVRKIVADQPKEFVVLFAGGNTSKLVELRTVPGILIFNASYLHAAHESFAQEQVLLSYSQKAVIINKMIKGAIEAIL